MLSYCPICDGKGSFMDTYVAGNGKITKIKQMCLFCSGSGIVKTGFVRKENNENRAK